MRRIAADEENRVNDIAAGLLEGQTVLLLTDTVYGLAAKPTCTAAVDKVYQLKGRPRDRHLPIMVFSPQDLDELNVDINSTAQCLLQSDYVPGALTLAVGLKPGARPDWLAGREEIAIRIPDDLLLLAVLEKTGPLFVTSANKHGSDTPKEISEIVAQLDGEPDIVVDSAADKNISLSDTPSTLINCRVTPPVIERHGQIPASDLFKLLENVS